MVERIVPATEALAERERKAIEDMRALFPDGNVSGLDTKDKSLGKRLSKLYVALGYESRSDMIEALGFRQERTNMGGRPTTLDPEAIFAELADRYDGVPKPKALGLLLNENPDMKGSLKTLQNKSNELFGHSLAKELVARGLLDKPSSDKPDISDEEILEAVGRLEKKYASADKKAKTLTALKKLEPEYVDVIDALDSKRSRELLGTTAADYFKSHGILAGGALYTDDADIEAAVAALADLSKEIPDDDKPKSIADVCARYPEYAALIKAGQQKKVLTKNTLMERGIIGLTQAAKKAKQKLERERCARNAEVPELLRMYCGSGGQMLVVPGQDNGFLRPGVIGLDVVAGYELRETTMLSARSADVKPGDELDVRYGVSLHWALPHGIELSKGNAQIANVPRPDCDAFVACQPFDVDTDLIQYVSSVVENVEQSGDKSFVRIRHRFLNPISSETMIFALRGIGAISDKELLGGDAWRDRLDAIPEDLGVIASKRPAAANEQKSFPVMGKKSNDDSPVPTSLTQMKTEERTAHVKYELSEKTPPASQPTENGEQEEEVEPLVETLTTESAPAIAFGVSTKSTPEGDASEAVAPTGFGFSISGKSMPSKPASNADDQADREEAERTAKEKTEQERLEAEERERKEAEEAERKRVEEERLKAEEEARKLEEERKRKEAEEAERKRIEEEQRQAEANKETPDEREARIKLLIIDHAKTPMQKGSLIDEVVKSQAGEPYGRALDEKEVERQFAELVKLDKLSVKWGMYHTNKYCSSGMVNERYRWHLEHVGEIPEDVKAMDGMERAQLAHEQAMFQFNSITNNDGEGKFIISDSGWSQSVADFLLESGGGLTYSELCSRIERAKGENPGEYLKIDLNTLQQTGVVVQQGSSYYLWTQHDADGRPMKDEVGDLLDRERQLKKKCGSLQSLEESIARQEKEVERLEAKVKSFGLFGGGSEKKAAKNDLKLSRDRLSSLQSEKSQIVTAKSNLESLQQTIEAKSATFDAMKDKFRWY